MAERMLALTEVVQFGSTLTAVLGVLAAIASVVSAMLADRSRSPSALAVDRDQLAQQIDEIDAYLEGQAQIATSFRVLEWVLNVSQYGVAAALLTSVVSENFSREVLGILGAVTLLSALMYQLLRPNDRRRNVALRVVVLRDMKRRAELELAELRLEEARGNSIPLTVRIELAKKYAKELHDIQLEAAKS